MRFWAYIAVFLIALATGLLLDLLGVHLFVGTALARLLQIVIAAPFAWLVIRHEWRHEAREREREKLREHAEERDGG